MGNMNEEVYKSKPALPNKLLQANGSVTDLAGNAVIGAVDAYESKPALPDKWLNPDGSYSTLAEIVSSMIDMELFIVVEELPATGEPNKIYLLVDGNKLIEYIWVNNAWDPVGMVEFDINNYYTKSEVTQLISASLNSANTYTDTKLVDYAKNTDYASSTKAGLIKTSNNYALKVNYTNAVLSCAGKTYAEYQNANNEMFIGKGTLENVIAGKELIDQSQLDAAIQASITNVLGGNY